MAPRKKRVAKSAAFSVRTRSGMKFQASKKEQKKPVVKNIVEVKKFKEAVPLLKQSEPMLTRSHKKFGKYRFFTENNDVKTHNAVSKDDATTSTENIESEIHSIEEILLPEPEVNLERDEEPVAEIVITDDTDEDVAIIHHDAPSVDVSSEENISQQSVENISLRCESASSQSEEQKEELESLEMECVVIQNPETLITEQLSNLDVNEQFLLQPKTDIATIIANESSVIQNVQYNTESEKSNVYHIENFESEVIIDCISEDVIPICSEQEIVNENDTSSDINEIDKEIIDVKADVEAKVYNTGEVIVSTIPDDSSLEDSQDKSIDLNIKIDSDSTNLYIQKDITKEEIINAIIGTADGSAFKIETNVDTSTERSNQDNIETNVEDLNKPNAEVEDARKEQSKTKVKSKLPKKKVVKSEKEDNSTNKLSESSVRRSNRIKSISVLKQKSSKGHGLVKQKNEQGSKNTEIDCGENNNPPTTDSTNKNGQKNTYSPVESVPIQNEQKPVKVKSRWRRSSELELNNTLPLSSSHKISTQVLPAPQSNVSDIAVEEVAIKKNTPKQDKEEVAKRLKQFVHLKENLYLTERISCKEAKKMVCDCFLTEDDIEQGDYGCGEDCLNRLLMIECGSLCAVGDRCTNKRFQKVQFAPCEVFRTDKKGLGIRAAANIPYGEFILEYVGEVLDPEEFEKRAAEYSQDKNQHYYFMSLRADAVIDATRKGNVSRFINHSCDPNAETQKWTVNGELRIGFFSKRTILAGEEITFDYQFQRYGKEAQKCFCEAATCRGWLGEEPDDDEDDDEDDEEEEEEEDEEEDEVEDTEIEKINDQATIKKDAEVATAMEKPESQEKPDEPLKPVVVKTEKATKKEKKRILRQRLPRKDIFEDLDLDDEIETLQTTGLKNQAHTLKLSRLMVRAKEPAQRTKLLRVLRRGELPCRRLFLDYHGLRLIHGWMTDAQHMSRINKKLESLRLEILQTLATLPIPNKTMLQDSKVLPTVEKWSVKLEQETFPIDSDSNSPKIESEATETIAVKNEEMKKEVLKLDHKISAQTHKTEISKGLGMRSGLSSNAADLSHEDMDISPVAFDEKESIAEVKSAHLRSQPPSSTLHADDYETEIIALALKLLEEWSGLKEVFRIPKKERIEQMKEHEREADRKYKDGLDGQEFLLEKKDWHRSSWSKRQKKKRRKNSRGDRDAYFDKYERRKMFALQVEQREMERRRSQREFWRQHEQRCVVMGADPRFTAPFEPNQGYQCVWNPQTGQWQNYPLPGNQNFNANIPSHHHLSHHHHHPQQQPQQPHLPPVQQHLPPIQQHLPPGQQLLPPGQQHLPPVQQHLPPGQPNQQQMLISQHNHMMSNQPPTMPVNHPSPSVLTPMQQNQQMMKHLQQPGNIPPSHSIHSKPPHVFNPQPPLPPHPSNPGQHQFNPRPSPNMNTPPSVPPSPYGQQQRGSNQCASYPPMLSDHIQQQHQPQLPNYHMTPDNANLSSSQMQMHVSGTSLQSNIHHKPPPPLPALPYQESIKEQDDVSQVKFMGPIPPAPKLPPKWKCAKDKYGRPYYYHIRIRKSQWEPPEFPPEENDELSESTSSSESSSVSSDTSSDETDSDDDIDDAKLLLQLKNKFASKNEKSGAEKPIVNAMEEGDKDDAEELEEKTVDDRLIEEFCFMKGDTSLHAKRKRMGLVQEILISPRTEEDKLQFKEDMKRYKQNKEKLKRQKELLVEQSKKHTSVKPSKTVTTPVKTTKSDKKRKISVKTKLKEMTDSESAKKIKESFRSSMAVVMVSILNTYRKPDCKEGRITNTDDFKHLARKLTHFVMLKELKHCQNIEDLTCTDSVKSKAREFVRKYMSKFGETYQKPKDEAEFY